MEKRIIRDNLYNNFENTYLYVIPNNTNKLVLKTCQYCDILILDA